MNGFFSSEKKNKMNQTNLYITLSVFKCHHCTYINERTRKNYFILLFLKIQKAFFNHMYFTEDKYTF